ncbi:MAG: hypothetical protein GY838_13170 [bacterium]|nr:hypothetical protein [bacterium]
MRTTDEIRALAHEKHAVEQAVRLERNFWQLVVLLGVIAGLLIGAGSDRIYSWMRPSTPIIITTAGEDPAQ